MADCAALLRRYTRKGIGGANPPLSASFLPEAGTSSPRPVRAGLRPTTRAVAIRPLLPFLSAGLLGACSGPRLHLQNPEGHPTFVDGVRTEASTLPFRYYGTTRWDALPKDIDEGRGPRPDWQRRPTHQEVAVPWPASPLLFPLDLPLEFTSWLLGGQQDVTATVAVPPVASVEPGDGGPGAAAGLRQRAAAARAAR